MKPEKILFAMNDIDAAIVNEARETASSGRKRKFTSLIAAVITLMALTVTAFAAEDIAGWFQKFLNTNFSAESWSDANKKEDYTAELLTEPVSGVPAYQFEGEGVIDLTVVSVRLRPGSLVMFYHATDFGSTFDYYPGGVKVIMLDGTETILALSGTGRVSEDPDSTSWAEYAANVPPIDEIDYILLADGTKLTVP